ncbi:MAG: hypothetical protein IT347_12410 [Candidatus Eisenbacteria bacterium]|nr:hypothetical protein [Candidatus Eisenbacteria bacterium]
MFTATIASAGTATPRVDRREARQTARIHQGVRSGELTRGEARSLRAGQRHVHRIERRAKADGNVSARERAHLNRAQNRQSRHIHRLKHNGRTR